LFNQNSLSRKLSIVCVKLLPVLVGAVVAAGVVDDWLWLLVLGAYALPAPTVGSWNV
jgi:hypothetical protein